MQPFSKYIEERFALTIKYHSRLNPKLWVNDELKDDYASVLLRHAMKFADYSGVNRSRVLDVVMTGGNCNYNYTKYSDIDVHLICDVSGLDQDALYDKKVKWTNEHKDLQLAGYPLEFYIEDSKQTRPAGQGVYSVMHDKWVTVPKHLDRLEVLNDPKVERKVKDYIAYIKKWLLKHGTAEQILDFKDKLWRMRSSGLETGGEFSVENVVYKDLRNRGLINSINDRLEELRSKA